MAVSTWLSSRRVSKSSTDRRSAWSFAVITALLLALFGGPMTGIAAAADWTPDHTTPGGTYLDDDGSIFEGAIEAIALAGITRGCSDRMEFCPDQRITRGEVAAFLVRALGIGASPSDWFTDDDGHLFEAEINAIAELGYTKGCNPPINDRFCPDRNLTRGEMAALLVRAFELPPATVVDRFTDDDVSEFQAEIDALAQSGITKGCNPPSNDRYCPKAYVTRGEMAAFITRALGLEELIPPPRPGVHLVSRFTTYHACCQPRVKNIQLLARTLNGHVILPGEVFDLNEVVGRRTTAKGYVPAPVIVGGELTMGVGGGISQFATTIYNTIFHGAYEDIEHRAHSIYIDRYPVGVEATLGYPSPNIVFRNDTWTPVTIRTSYTSTSIRVELWGNNDGRTVVGSHRNGKTTVTVTKTGGSEARKVTWSVSPSTVPAGGGTVRITRTITGPDGTTTKTWWHTYN